MVILRRLRVLLICLVFGIVAPAAVASPRDVVDDYESNNATITRCHPREDYEAALKQQVDATYGDFVGAVETALATPELVGTPERPCPDEAAASGGSSTATVLVALGAAAVLIGAGILVARRRRPAGGEGGEG